MGNKIVKTIENLENTNMMIKEFPNKSDLPLTPEEFIGKEPSLKDLNLFVERSKLSIPDELKSGIQEYTSMLDRKWRKNHYYLLGHLPLEEDDKLTSERLAYCVELENKEISETGGPSHQGERWIMQNHHKWFLSIKSLINLYYKVKIEEYYAPGGDGFTDAMKRFNERNH